MSANESIDSKGVNNGCPGSWRIVALQTLGGEESSRVSRDTRVRNQTSLSTEREVSRLFRHARENARKVEEHRAQNSAHDHAV